MRLIRLRLYFTGFWQVKVCVFFGQNSQVLSILGFFIHCETKIYAHHTLISGFCYNAERHVCWRKQKTLELIARLRGTSKLINAGPEWTLVHIVSTFSRHLCSRGFLFVDFWIEPTIFNPAAKRQSTNAILLPIEKIIQKQQIM